jgi:hypothetical protein
VIVVVIREGVEEEDGGVLGDVNNEGSKGWEVMN